MMLRQAREGKLPASFCTEQPELATLALQCLKVRSTTLPSSYREFLYGAVPWHSTTRSTTLLYVELWYGAVRAWHVSAGMPHGAQHYSTHTHVQSLQRKKKKKEKETKEKPGERNREKGVGVRKSTGRVAI